MTFIAFVSPPYTDLYDFTWELDGAVVPGESASILQKATSDLAQTQNGEHAVRVTAVGARDYPHELLAHTPPTLAVACTFKVL